MNNGNFGDFNNEKVKEIFSNFFRGFKRNDINKIKSGSIKSFIKWLVTIYIVIGIILAFTSSLIFDVTLNAFLLAMPFIVISLIYGIIYSMKGLRRLGVISAILYFSLVLIYSPIISYKSHRDIIGTVDQIEFSSEIEHIDLKQLPIIDTELAGKLADKKLGEISSLGSQVTIGRLCLQSIKGELYYVAPLEHSSIIKWFTNREGTRGYIKVSATNQNDVQLVTELNGNSLNIKYLESAYLFSDLNRAAYLRDMTAGHTEYLHKVIN